MDTEERNAVMVAGLLQVLFIVFGFAVLALVMKFNGYPQEIFIRWNPLARYPRERGALLLLIPLVWTIFTFITCLVDRGFLSPGCAAILGIILAGALLVAFLSAAFDSYRRPLLMDVGPPSSSSH